MILYEFINNGNDKMWPSRVLPSDNQTANRTTVRCQAEENTESVQKAAY